MTRKRFDEKKFSLPHIQKPEGLVLPPHADQILKMMFPEYQRVVIKDEFVGASFSGSRVFQVHLIREDAAPELPLVVKISSVSLIQKEWLAYQNCIRGRWLGIAELQGEPVIPPGSHLAGLAYSLMGGGVFEMKSLHRYCLEANLEDVRFVLQERLFQMMRKCILQPSHNVFEYTLRASYDALLPTNLLIKATALSPDLSPLPVKPDICPVTLQPGDPVRLSGFIISKANPQQRTITLNLPFGHPLLSYKITLSAVRNLAAFQINQPISPLEGIVIETRQSRLQAELKTTLDPEFDSTQESITLPSGRVLPNPLLTIGSLLNQTRNVKINCVHGDLNMENILVDTQVRDIRLIDFADARETHVLHDFLRLETEVIIKLMPPILRQANLPPETIYSFYEQLHCTTFQGETSAEYLRLYPALERPFIIIAAIRETSRWGLYDPEDYAEYYQGLILYLLTTLKYRNLNEVPEAPAPKQLAFWGAATLQQFLASAPPCSQARSARPETTAVPAPSRADNEVIAGTATPGSGSIQTKSQKVRGPTNPFIYGNPITNPVRFVGRRREINQIQSRLLNAEFESSSIVGERRIGKTSLLKYLSHAEVTRQSGFSPDHYIFVYVDLQILDATKKPVDFWQRILHAIKRQVDDAELVALIDEVCREQSIDTFILDDLFSLVDDINLHIVLLLDEFEKVTQNRSFDVDFFSGLRAMAIHHNLALITSSRRELVDLTHSKEVQDSPFFNIFANVNLRPFFEDEAQTLIETYLAGREISFQQQDIDYILQIAGLYPYFLQMASYLLYESYRQQSDPHLRYHSLNAEFREKAGPMFADYWHHFAVDQRILLTIMALRHQTGRDHGGDTLEQLKQFYKGAEHTLQALEKHGLALAEPDQPPRYRCFSAVFCDWVTRQLVAGSGSGEAWFDWQSRQMKRLNKLTPQARQRLLTFLPRLNSAHAGSIGDWLLNPATLNSALQLLENFLDDYQK